MNTSPQVTQIEIESWEQKFREQVSASVQFDKDENGNSSLKISLILASSWVVKLTQI